MKKPKPINETFLLDTETKREYVSGFISKIPLEPVYCVRVYEDKETRRIAQNALYWKWLTHISGEGIFSTKEDAHEHYKKSFLIHIYERDDPDYAAMIEAVRVVYRAGLKTQSQDLIKKIVMLTSTTTASVKQFTEYLKEIENDCNNMNIYLPHREDDQYRKAMG